MPNPNPSQEIDDLIARTERMRQEALAYQVETGGREDVPYIHKGLMGECDALVELGFLTKGIDHQGTKTPSGPEGKRSPA
jgi:hypothetical protein